LGVLYISLAVIVIDQISKFLVKGGTIPLLGIHAKGMEYGQSLNVFGDFFKITFVENPGLAFGIDINHISKLLLSLFSLVASIGILYYIWKSKEQKLIIRIALAFVLGGAVGNLIDRAFYGIFYHYAPIFYGRVVDFFNMDFWDFTIFGRTYERFPIFNIADSAVTVGVVLLILFYRNPEEEKKEEEKLAVDTQTTEDVSVPVPELKTENDSVKDAEVSNRKEI
jgi:signal peptidase II